MADTKISLLPTAASLADADIFVINQGGTTKTIPTVTVSQKIQADYTAAQVLNGSVASATYSVAANLQTPVTITVTGAALGDFALASSSVSTTTLQLTASVTAANTVTVILKNTTASAISLTSAIIRARVWKQ
jgi:hypothetical protein